jgi:imidazoleglycerol-phosphate dehydratase
VNSVYNVLEKIVSYQKEHGYSDQQMADKIGCSRPLYQRTRTGRIQVGGTFLKGAMKLLEPSTTGSRCSSIKRETKETNISLELNIDGTGKWKMATGIHIFDHLLSAMMKHGLFDIKLTAAGDDPHHLIEDVAICYAVLDLPFAANDMSSLPADLIRHFLESFAFEARMNLHARILYGTNDHHKAEALFKALGRALDKATRLDPRIAGEVPSTKEFLET